MDLGLVPIPPDPTFCFASSEVDDKTTGELLEATLLGEVPGMRIRTGGLGPGGLGPWG